MSKKGRAIVMAFGLLCMIVGIGINSIVTFFSGVGFTLLADIDSIGGDNHE